MKQITLITVRLIVVAFSLESASKAIAGPKLLELPDGCLQAVFSLVSPNSSAKSACTASQAHRLIENGIKNRLDGVQLRDGTWVYLPKALKERRLLELKLVKDFGEKLHSQEELRRGFIEGLLVRSSQILADHRLTFAEKKQGCMDLLGIPLNLGLTTTLDAGSDHADRVSGLILYTAAWKQAQFKIGSLDLRDITGMIRHDIWTSYEKKIAELLKAYFALGEEHLLDQENSSLIALGEQNRFSKEIATLFALHSPEFASLRKSLTASLREERSDDDLLAALEAVDLTMIEKLAQPHFFKLLARTAGRPCPDAP